MSLQQSRKGGRRLESIARYARGANLSIIKLLSFRRPLARERQNTRQREISIIAFPRHGSPYVELFYSALHRHGANASAGVFEWRWLLRNLRAVDYVHLHWPHQFYQASSRGECLLDFARFLFFIILARLRRLHVIWTVHNLYPHEHCILPRLDLFVRYVLVRFCAAFLVHGSSAEDAVIRAFPKVRGRTIIIDHGHFLDVYPNKVAKSYARATLGLREEEYAFLFIGAGRPYKNLGYLIDQFNRIQGDICLLIAGDFVDSRYHEEIKAKIDTSPGRVFLHAGFIPDDQIGVFLNACDAVVAPYRDILTSGTAMLAMSFGRPLIAPALGFLRDAVRSDSGILYDPAEPDALYDSMTKAMVTRFDPDAIQSAAAGHDWGRSAEHLVAALCKLR